MEHQFIKEEALESRLVIQEESAGAPKQYFIEGIFMQAEVKNRNSRVYPRKVLTEAVSDYQSTHITKNRGYGELGHPSDPGIHFDRVCILTQELREEGNNVFGRAKVLNTPCGKIVKELIDEGVQLGVSTRGVGGIKNGVVQNGFRLVAAVDVVADPSAPDAFVTALVENKEWVMENGVLVEREMEEIRKGVMTINEGTVKDAEIAAFRRFMSRLQGN
jgi:hypothetical protein